MTYGVAGARNTNNWHYEPSKVGLNGIEAMSQAGLSYEFHVMNSWLHEPTGRVFWAIDSGCSCPSEYENDWFNGPDDTSLEELTEASRSNFERAVESFPADSQERFKFARNTLYIAGLIPHGA